MKLVRLSKSFYSQYGCHKEILKKEPRPYMCLTISIDSVEYAIPFRHHFSHPYGFHTGEECGLDFSKAVPILNASFIDSGSPRIDSAEWNIVKRNENRINMQFKKYLKLYKKALVDPDNPRYQKVLEYSSLQYFDLFEEKTAHS